ncbi:MAG TPA: ACT domain-containing protein [Polyangiaceae bacterium]|nr:ACT domain-containing protein [Polyangiaceae bacterium]
MATERRYAVLTAIGPDRPGLVHEVSQTINDASGNLEDSRMAVLGGEFALIVLLSGASPAIDRVRARLPELEKRLGLRVSMHDTRAAEASRGATLYRLRVTGVDRPGIVLAISKTLASRGINVVSLESRLTNAPESGTPLFVLVTEIQLPSDVALSSLRQKLTEVCDAEDLDFELEAL